MKHFVMIMFNSVALILFALNGAEGQDLKQDLLKISSAYRDADLNVKVRVHIEDPEDQPMTVNASILKYGQMMYSNISGIETLVTKDLVVSHSHLYKLTSYYKRSKQDELDFSDMSMVNIDTMLVAYDNISYLGNKEGSKHYKVRQKEGMIEWIELYIDDRTGFLNRVYYTYREKVGTETISVDIRYEYGALDALVNDKRLSLSHFIVTKDGKRVSAMREYRLKQLESTTRQSFQLQ
ncbi:hypothetical protein [Aureibacter tunicatorum]|uniref:Outer membrane lipoprotein-sorting protein n=1 Tax=Aureibacter tunicatorum TaxID=866807 RepID=A0AAE4BU92_9BACT|nr:hypothetical protein [Aureibacter tunicatorum]MDR6240477.1 hypothetical protein [Aureibacter tunicatorum]BDD05644.1 hypothetical protein AUTU_31270 [Aureibacter tunicatorum]